MKNIIWPIVVIVLAAGWMFLSRYELMVKPPVVAKIDRLTGDTWIVNSGYWTKIQEMPKGGLDTEPAEASADTSDKKTQ